MVAVQADSMDSPVEDEAKKLRRHFKFTEDDLEVNRRGELSDKQKARLEKYDAGGRKLGITIGSLLVGGGVVFGAIGYFMYAAYNDPFFRNSENWIFTVAPAGCMGAFGLLLAAAGIFLIVSQFIKHKPFKVLSVRGPARLEKGTMSHSQRAYYDLYINDQEFDGDGSMPNLIQQGVEYIVYYLNTTQEIISVERA